MTAPTASPSAFLEQYTVQLAEPAPAPPDEPWAVQSLADGAAGVSLLHIEMAGRHGGSWRSAHRWITAAATGHISAADTTGLFLGAPAIGFVLTTVPPPFQHLYNPARRTLHQHITALTHRRVDAALTRIRNGDLPTFAEYDLFYGLTGIGAYLLRADPGGIALERVLRYLVALTRPLAPAGRGLPGWWVRHDPARGDSPTSRAATPTSVPPTESPAHSFSWPRQSVAASPSTATGRPCGPSASTLTSGASSVPPVPGGPSTSRAVTSTADALTMTPPPGRAGATEPRASHGPGNSPDSPYAPPTSRPSTKTPCTAP